MQYDTVIGILTISQIELFAECIESIRANTPLSERDIVIIANNSIDEDYTEKVEKIAKDYGFANVNFRRKRGTSAGWNAMSRMYDCKNIAIISDDVIVHEGWRETMDEILDAPRAGVVSVRGWNGRHEWKMRNSMPFAAVRHRKDAQFVTYPTGFLLMYAQSKFQEIGGFDENLPLGLEDVDFALNMMKHGYENYQIGIIGDVYRFANHWGSASGDGEAGLSIELQEIKRQGAKYLMKKHNTQWPLTQEFEKAMRELSNEVARQKGI